MVIYAKEQRQHRGTEIKLGFGTLRSTDDQIICRGGNGIVKPCDSPDALSSARLFSLLLS